MSMYWSVETSCRIRSIGNSGARSSGPIGCPVPGCSTGGGGVGRSCSTLYQRVGSSSSGSRILVGVMHEKYDSPGTLGNDLTEHRAGTLEDFRLSRPRPGL